jgi:POT family proton-dependent oligopeptide transporter
VTWLPSQLQSLNSIFVLTFIPLFAFVVYPVAGRFVRLTPLRKIGVGFFLAWGAFLMVARIQESIDAGVVPSVGWQILACALLTAGEVMIAIVSLEFAYTQAPRALKSLVMCYYLGAVALGNVFVAVVNTAIQVPDTAAVQLAEALRRLPPDWQRDPRTVMLPGHDGITGTADDLVQRLRDGRPLALEIPGQEMLETAAEMVIAHAGMHADTLPREAPAAMSAMRDQWGNPPRYQLVNASKARVISMGPDGDPGTEWDIGIEIEVRRPISPPTPTWADALRPAETWLDRRRRELGQEMPSATNGTTAVSYHTTTFAGGLTRLEGAPYFHFFSWIMLGTAVLFIPYAYFYKNQTWLQETTSQGTTHDNRSSPL